jgi:parvulin-like peptidyl-prolyl isomerase
MKDPSIAAMIGQNPQAQRIMAALQAHIAEHLGFQYRQDIEEKLGAPLPPPGEELPEQIEVDLSRLVAEAGAQLMQSNQQKAAAQKAQQQAQDPVMQQKQAELQLRAQEVQRKAAKDQQDTQIKQAELQRKTQKDQMDAMLDTEKLKLDQQELQMDAQQESTRLDLELAKLSEQPK